MSDLDYDFGDVFDTVYGNDTTGGADKVMTMSTREVGDTDGQTADDVELWMHGCMVYRPADPTDDGKCQVLMVQTGARKVGIASRDLRSQKTFGDVNKGDAAFGSPTGGVVLRCNADGSGGLRHSDPGDGPDAYLQLEKDGTWIIGNQWGQIELGDAGFVVVLATGESLSLTKEGFSCSGKCAALQTSSVALGAGASVPLAAVPITGTAGAGFVTATPIMSITAPPG